MLIKLTRSKAIKNESVIWIQFSFIESMTVYEQSTSITLSSGEEWRVDETPEEIIELESQSRKSFVVPLER